LAFVEASIVVTNFLDLQRPDSVTKSRLKRKKEITQ
jgi:hypothetical protein